MISNDFYALIGCESSPISRNVMLVINHWLCQSNSLSIVAGDSGGPLWVEEDGKGNHIP